MGIKDLIIKNCYLGYRNVIKLYKGEELLYEQAPAGVFRTENGKVIIPKGTKLEITDYSSPTYDVIPYYLPEDMIIPDTSGNVTMSDGNTIRYDATVEETNYDYNANVRVATRVDDTSGHVSNWTDISYKGSSTFMMQPYQWFQSSASNGKEIVCQFEYTCDGDPKNHIGFRVELNSASYATSVAKICLHKASKYTRNQQAGGTYDTIIPNNTDLISADDIELTYTAPTNKYIYPRCDGELEKGAKYQLYIVWNSIPTYGSNLTNSIYLYEFYKANVIHIYDQNLNWSGYGYSFGSDPEIQISATKYSVYTGFLGTCKYNPTDGFYDGAPPEPDPDDTLT